VCIRHEHEWKLNQAVQGKEGEQIGGEKIRQNGKKQSRKDVGSRLSGRRLKGNPRVTRAGGPTFGSAQELTEYSSLEIWEKTGPLRIEHIREKKIIF